METNYRNILKQSYQDRSTANPGYSIRSFARDLGTAPSSLSEILNGKKGISPKRSYELAQKLKLPDWQAQLFCDLVAVEHAKSPRVRAEAKERLEGRLQENQLHILNQNTMRALTSWIDLAVLELTYMKDFESNPQWIARKLDIEEDLAKNSVLRLRNAGLLKIDSQSGVWQDASPLLSSTDGVPDEAIRLFHHTVLNLALKKMESRNVHSRTVKSVIFSISESNRQRARKILDEAISKIVALADEKHQERSDVMCFSTQLFSLLDGGKI